MTAAEAKVKLDDADRHNRDSDLEAKLYIWRHHFGQMPCDAVLDPGDTTIVQRLCAAVSASAYGRWWKSTERRKPSASHTT